MKKYSCLCTVIALLSSIGMEMAGQSLPGGDFESYDLQSSGDCSITNEINRSFEKAPIQSCSFLQDEFSAWFATHGTPEIFQNLEVITTKRLSLWSGTGVNLWEDVSGIYGEGVALSCPYFEEGKRYTLRFSMMTTPVIDEVNIYLYKGSGLKEKGISYTDPSFYRIPSIPASDKQLIFKALNYQNPGNMQMFEFTFIPNDEYHTLWLYISDASSSQDFAYFDNFSFVECDPGSEVFTSSQGFNSLTREEYIRFTDAFSYSMSSENIEVLAGDYIEMLPETEFSINSSSSALFDIYKPCSLPDFFCQPADPSGMQSGKKALSSEKPMENLPLTDTKIYNPVKFYINDMEFNEARLFVEKNDCFSVAIYDLAGSLLFQEKCVVYDEAFKEISSLRKQILIVKITYQDQQTSSKVLYN